jgi:DNA-binding response OmpR family regulator
MKYALVLEKNSALCNDTTAVLQSMGYLTTPVFNQKKALYAARLIQFDLIITCTAVNPGDRRSLTGELKRCLPEATVILLADPESGPAVDGNTDGVSAVLYRPLTAQEVRSVLECGEDRFGLQPPPAQPAPERRRSIA